MAPGLLFPSGMPNKEFLESWPLYKRFQLTRIHPRLENLPKPDLDLWCDPCRAKTSHAMANSFQDASRFHNPSVRGLTLRMNYLCDRCERGEHQFYARFEDDSRWISKIGQFPAPRTALDPLLESALADHGELYRKGLACEHSGQGIGAYWYYRRLVEETLPGIVAGVENLVDAERLASFLEGLEKMREAPSPLEAISGIQDHLPAMLRPGQANLLAHLASELETGAAAKEDGICLTHARRVRSLLVFLMHIVEKSRRDTKMVAEGMRLLFGPDVAEV